MGFVVDPVTLERGLRGRFVKAFDNAEAPAEVMPYIMETESDGPDEKYGWLGQSPTMREWIDERHIKGLLDFDYTIPNKDYEATLGVDRNSIQDDRLGAVNMRIDDLAKRAKVHPRKLFFALLETGEVELAYDGQPFFSDSHEEGDSGIQSNLQTGTGVSLAQLKADMIKAVATMKSYKDDTGEPLDEGAVKIGVICHPDLENAFDELNTLVQISNSSNSMKGKIKSLLTSSRITDLNDWYIANISDGLKPVVKQNRMGVQFDAQERNSSAGFMKKKWLYGVNYRIGFGFGLWQKMIKVTNT